MSVKEAGFSLPEIIIAVGLLAGISLVTMKILDNQANNEGRLKSQAEIQKTVAILKSILNNPEACKQMLLGQPLSSSAGIATNIIKPAAVPAGEKAGLYQSVPNHNAPGTFTFKQILAIDSNYGRFRIGPAGSIQLVKATDSNTNIDAIDLVIQFRTETKGIIFKQDDTSPDRTVTQRIPLMVTFTPGTPDTISNCGLVVSDANIAAKKKLCDSMGALAQWDAGINRCSFRASACPAGQVPEEQVKTAAPTAHALVCVPLSAQFNVQDLFDTTSIQAQNGCTSLTGRYRLERITAINKLRLVCD